jgi:hypothetical protein
MQWPWVSRRYLNDAIAVTEQSYERNILALHGQLARAIDQAEFWQAKYEKEQARADRAVDSLVVAAGHQPISEESRTEVAKISDASIEMSKQVAEIFGDVENSVVEDPSTQVVLNDYKEPTKEQIEADRNARLEAIRARIEARKLAETAEIANTASESVVVGA